MEPERQPDGTDRILAALDALERRIAGIERRIERVPDSALDDEGDTDGSGDADAAPSSRGGEAEDRLEMRIGQFWLARAGILVLTAGLAFLLTLPYGGAPAIVPPAIGFVSAAVLAMLAFWWRDTMRQFSQYLLGGALIVLYVSVLRLSYFGAPVVTAHAVLVVLLLAASAASVTVGVRRNSAYITALALGFGYATALVSNADAAFFAVELLVSAAVVALGVRRWYLLVWYGVAAACASHLLWFIGNPLMGNGFVMMTGRPVNLAVVLVLIVLFSAASLARRDRAAGESPAVIFTALVTAATGTGTLLVVAFLGTPDVAGWVTFLASVVLLGIAMTFWVRERSVYATFFFAMSGYGALSAAIVSAFAVPDVFLWLCLQSLLVVSTAVWFRSRFIVVANFVIYLLVLVAYLVVAERVTALGLVFGVAALLSARILSWRRERLTLKTDIMRTAYLLVATIVVPLSLAAILPAHLVGISWLGVAGSYYLIGRVLRNRKYRMMALATLLATVVYVLGFGLGGIPMEYRVLSFVAVGAALLVVSALYFRIGRRAEKHGDGHPATPH